MKQRYEKTSVPGVQITDNALDYIRLCTTFIVFFGHFLTHFFVESETLFFLAYIVRGVPVFFLLSGFFIANSLERYAVKEYAIRRFTRIYPALWVCVLLNLGIILLFYARKPTVLELFIYLVTQLTFLQFYTGAWLRGYGTGVPNGALWTISADIQFYVVAVFLAKWLKTKRLGVWIGVVFLCQALSWGLLRLEGVMGEMGYKFVNVMLPAFLYIFLFGMMTYYHKDRLIACFVKWRWGILVLYLVWSFLPVSVTGLFEGVRYNIVTTTLLMMLVMGMGFGWGKHRLKREHSYGFYLYHMVVINFVIGVLNIERFASVEEGVWVFVLVTGAIIVMGLLSEYFVEYRISKALERRMLSNEGYRQGRDGG